MKKYRIIGILLLLLMGITLSCKNDLIDFSSQDTETFKDKIACMNWPRPVDAYNYPVYPGMNAWENFSTIEDMIEACQIPKAKLQSMSTNAVIQAIWEYPFFFQSVHRPGLYQTDFDYSMRINTYDELINREDASFQLLERYRVMSGVCISFWDPLAFEVLLSQRVFLSQMSQQELLEVVRLAFEKQQARQIDPASSDFLDITCFLIGRVMQSAQYKPFVDEVNQNNRLKNFLETSEGGLIGEDENPLLNSIVTFAKEFAKDK